MKSEVRRLRIHLGDKNSSVIVSTIAEQLFFNQGFFWRKSLKELHAPDQLTAFQLLKSYAMVLTAYSSTFSRNTLLSKEPLDFFFFIFK